MTRRAYSSNREEDALIGDIDAKARKASAPAPKHERCPRVIRFREAADDLLSNRGPGVAWHEASDVLDRSWRQQQQLRANADKHFPGLKRGNE